MKSNLVLGIVTSTKTLVRCLFCSVSFPKPTKCIEQHTNGTKHKENMELMAENGISFNQDVLYCKPCKTAISENESISEHIDADTHANWMEAMETLVDEEFINLDTYLASSIDDDNINCDACKCMLPCTLSQLEEHVKGFNHRANVADKLKPLNGIFPVDNEEELWCKVCDMFIENTVKSVLSHIDTEESHLDWFDDIEDVTEGHNVTTVEYLANEHYNKAFCNKCNVEILCNVQNIEEHVLSEAHLNKF